MLVRNSTLVGREIPQCKCIRSKFFALSGPSASTGRKGVFSSVARRTRPVEGVEGRGGGVEKQERRRGKRETERKGGRGCEGDRQTDRQTDKQTEGERQTERDRQAERQRGRESGQRFRLVILVVTSGLIFVDVVLVVVEVAALLYW